MIKISSGIWVSSKIKSCAWVTWSLLLIHLYLSAKPKITFLTLFFFSWNYKNVCLCPPFTHISWPLFHSLLFLVILQIFIWVLNNLKFLLCYYWDVVLIVSTHGFHPFVLWSIASHFSWHHTVRGWTVKFSEVERHLCHATYVFRFKTTNPYN